MLPHTNPIQEVWPSITQTSASGLWSEAFRGSPKAMPPLLQMDLSTCLDIIGDLQGAIDEIDADLITIKEQLNTVSKFIHGEAKVVDVVETTGDGYNP